MPASSMTVCRRSISSPTTAGTSSSSSSSAGSPLMKSSLIAKTWLTLRSKGRSSGFRQRAHSPSKVPVIRASTINPSPNGVISALTVISLPLGTAIISKPMRSGAGPVCSRCSNELARRSCATLNFSGEFITSLSLPLNLYFTCLGGHNALCTGEMRVLSFIF